MQKRVSENGKIVTYDEHGGASTSRYRVVRVLAENKTHGLFEKMLERVHRTCAGGIQSAGIVFNCA